MDQYLIFHLIPVISGVTDQLLITELNKVPRRGLQLTLVNLGSQISEFEAPLNYQAAYKL